LEIDPGVSAAIQEKRNTKNKLQKMDPGSRESPQYLWSWIVYFIRHIGRPALKEEVREAFQRAHPSLVRVGGRSIGLGEGQEWLSVPAAMAAAFPNGELSAFSEAQRQPKRRKRAADNSGPALPSFDASGNIFQGLAGALGDGSNDAWGLENLDADGESGFGGGSAEPATSPAAAAPPEDGAAQVAARQ